MLRDRLLKARENALPRFGRRQARPQPFSRLHYVPPPKTLTKNRPATRGRFCGAFPAETHCVSGVPENSVLRGLLVKPREAKPPGVGRSRPSHYTVSMSFKQFWMTCSQLLHISTSLRSRVALRICPKRSSICRKKRMMSPSSRLVFFTISSTFLP